MKARGCLKIMDQINSVDLWPSDDEIEKVETSRDKVRRFIERSRERKRPKSPQQSCATVALLPKVLIEGNSYSEIQTIASNALGKMARKTRRCVARSVSWPAYRYQLLFFSQRLQGRTCRHSGYSKWLSPRMHRCVFRSPLRKTRSWKPENLTQRAKPR